MRKEIHYSTYHDVIGAELRAALGRYHEKWEEVLGEEPAKRTIYLSTIERHRLSVVILSCTLLEAMINFYIGAKCKGKKFRELQARSLFKKWTECPKELAPNFHLPAELRDDLRKLIDRRNDIIHHKPFISIDGDRRHKGNEPDVDLDEHDFICRSATLPQRLQSYLFRAHPDDFMMLTCLDYATKPVAADCESALRRQARHAKIPRDLIVEIMEQGHDRKTATLYAAMALAGPKEQRTGEISWVMGGKRVTLKPLKFFAKG